MWRVVKADLGTLTHIEDAPAKSKKSFTNVWGDYILLSKVMNSRIQQIDDKLKQLRIDYLKASKGMRAFIVAGAKLLKEEREALVKKEEKEKNAANQQSFG